MIVGIMILEMHSGVVHSLKEKRQLVGSLKERLRNRFNVVVIESAHLDVWQSSQVSVITASVTRPVLDGVMSRVESFVAENYPMFSVHVERKFI